MTPQYAAKTLRGHVAPGGALSRSEARLLPFCPTEVARFLQQVTTAPTAVFTTAAALGVPGVLADAGTQTSKAALGQQPVAAVPTAAAHGAPNVPA